MHITYFRRFMKIR